MDLHNQLLSTMSRALIRNSVERAVLTRTAFFPNKFLATARALHESSNRSGSGIPSEPFTIQKQQSRPSPNMYV